MPIPSAATRFAVLTTITLAIATLLVATVPSAAITPSHAQSNFWPDWVARPVAPQCAVGEQPLVPRFSRVDSYGVAHFSYVGAPGLETAAPPRGFRSAVASRDTLNDLRMSGIQGRALNEPPNVRAFCMSSSRSNTNWSPIAGPDEGTGVPADTVPSPHTHQDSYSWAGFLVDGTWDGAQGSWTVEQNHPQVNFNDEATWVGVGGSANDVAAHHTTWGLIQVGTEMKTNAGYRSWFEYVCATAACTIDPQYHNYGGVTFNSGLNDSYLRPGDSIWALTYWASATEACFEVSDQTRASGTFSGCINNIGVPYDRTSMEFIDESAYHDYGVYPSNFDHTYWTQGNAFNSSNGTYKSFTSYGYYSSIMVDGTGATLPPCNPGIMAYPENASSGGSFDTVFCAPN